MNSHSSPTCTHTWLAMSLTAAFNGKQIATFPWQSCPGSLAVCQVLCWEILRAGVGEKKHKLTKGGVYR